MRFLDFDQPIECGRIEAAGGIGKAGIEYWNAEGIRNHAAASLAAPGDRPNGFARPDRLAGAAIRAEPPRRCAGSIHRASALTVTPVMMSAMPSSWIAGNGSPKNAVAPSGTNTKLSATNG